MIGALRQHLTRLSGDSESGQALVEFVLVFPMQLLLTLSILQVAFLAHAHMVVSQAAFQGARAGAVADVGVKDPAGVDGAITKAGQRSAARVCAVLTTEYADAGSKIALTKTVGPEGRLVWRGGTGSGYYGFSQERQDQAYELLTAKTRRESDGWVVCDVEFDYIMQIPVANWFLTTFSSRPGVYGGKTYPTFRIRRVGFVPTPWTKQGIKD